MLLVPSPVPTGVIGECPNRWLVVGDEEGLWIGGLPAQAQAGGKYSMGSMSVTAPLIL
jgi:hypothetical protein